jgi:hypothetical protein
LYQKKIKQLTDFLFLNQEANVNTWISAKTKFIFAEVFVLLKYSKIFTEVLLFKSELKERLLHVSMFSGIELIMHPFLLLGIQLFVCPCIYPGVHA